MSIRIDNEFKSLIPPLSDEEYRQLEENCIKDGIRDPLVVWHVPNGDDILVDGHNRFEISAKHGGIPFQIKRMTFSLREDVIRWIILNQFGRRNLSAYDRSILALKLKPIVAEQAKKNQIASGGAVPQKSVKPIDTQKELAKVAGVSHDTIHKVEVIQNSGDKKLIEDVRNGETSINKAYQTVKGIDPVKPKTPAQMRREHFEKAKEEHEAFQSQKIVGVSEIAKDKENRKKIAEALRLTLLGLGKPIENFFTRMAEGEVDMKAFRKELSDKEADQIVGMIAIWKHDLSLILQEVIGD
jgi:hypothetical protein